MNIFTQLKITVYFNDIDASMSQNNFTAYIFDCIWETLTER
jgi:hypothetical protein